MKKIIFVFTLILLASCTAKIKDRVYVEKVESSDLSNYLYKITIGSFGETDVVYYTNYKFQVGDSLISSNELLSFNQSQLNKSITLSDSLIISNKILQEKISELEVYNKILLKIIQSQNLIENE